MGAMIGTKVQQDTFKSRLGRIQAGGVNTTRHVYVGPVDEAVGEKTSRKAKAAKLPRAAGERSFFGEALMIPISLAAGALAVLAARVIAFRFLTQHELYAAEFYGVSGATIAVVGMALVFALILRAILGLKQGVRGRALFVGFVAMFFFEGYVVSQAPELFAPLYSPAYVEQVVAQVN